MYSRETKRDKKYWFARKRNTFTNVFDRMHFTKRPPLSVQWEIPMQHSSNREAVWPLKQKFVLFGVLFLKPEKFFLIHSVMYLAARLPCLYLREREEESYVHEA